MSPLDLFGNPVGGTVGAAAVPEDLRRIAQALPREIRLGTSSWSFPGWAGIVYDRKLPESRLAREGLAAYARHPLLRTVSIDRTFYAPISSTAFAEYAAAVPDDFRFLVKAPSLTTSPSVRAQDGTWQKNERWLDAAWAAEMAIGPMIEGLGVRAGPLVFQFPPQGGALTRQPARFADLLAVFLAALPRGPLYAVEVRDRDLFTPGYLAVLEAAGARHCFAVHPRMPSVADQWALVRTVRPGPLVVRWMLGGDQEYEEARSRYVPFDRLVDEDPATREVLAALAADHARRGLESFIAANNKAEGSAPQTVFKLAGRIVARTLGV